MAKPKEGEVFFTINIKAIPGSSKNTIQIRENNILTVHLSALPEKGKANKKVIELIANWLGLNKKEVTIVKGETSREKLIQLPIKYQQLFKEKIEELKTTRVWGD